MQLAYLVRLRLMMTRYFQPQILKVRKIIGRSLVFRDANVSDASFILSLRMDSSLNQFLSKTSPELSDQEKFLENYERKISGEAYFVIEKEGQPVGTVRLYDPQGDSFCWGSWIVKEGESPAVAIESLLMVYAFGCDFLGFNWAHFDVRRENRSVWRFHESFGAKRTSENTLDIFYAIDRNSIDRARRKYKNFLPEGIKIDST